MSTAAAANPNRATPADPERSWTDLGILSAPGLVMTCVVAVAFFGLFYRWFLRQNRWSWTQPEDWAHAYFIPLISLYLLYQYRHELARARVEPFWPGLAPMLLGIMCYLTFSVGAMGNHMFQGLSIILTLFGLVLLLLGTEVIRSAFIPIAYLVFGITISQKIMIAITFQLQLLASKGAWVVMSIVGAPLGISAEAQGNVLTVVSSSGVEHPLNVADACSGMRMVIAFFALGAAVALIACKQWWQRVALILLAAPVALVMNIIRVAVLGGLSLVNDELSKGQTHTLIGTLLLVPGLGLFMLIVWSLNRMVQEPAAEKVVEGNVGGGG